MTKDPVVYLSHIRDAIVCIKRYTVGGKKQFFADEKTQDAVIYNLAIIGEAVKQLPKDMRREHPTIPWKQIAGMRDVVIHDYDSTEIERIWMVVVKDLPVLAMTIKTMLAKRAA